MATEGTLRLRGIQPQVRRYTNRYTGEPMIVDEKHAPQLTAARAKILTEVNATRKDRDPFTARDIQIAVHIARKFKLVDNLTLVQAGFQPRKEERKHAKAK